MKKAFSLIELSIVVLIIGILIAGVTQSSRLISKAKLNTARTLTDSSPVASIKDLVVWLETTSEKSFDVSETEDGTEVTNWYDINPQVVTKSNGSGQSNNALYTAEAINGLPSLRFRGSTVGYYTVALNNVSLNSTKTIFVVARSLADRRHYIFDNVKDSEDPQLQYAFIINTKTSSTPVTYFQLYAGSYDGTYGLTSPNDTAAAETNYVTTLVMNEDNSIIRYNGNEITGDVGVHTMESSIYIGRSLSDSASDEYLDGYLGEFIIFDRVLKTEEYLAVEQYLSKKWGIDLAS